jgi:hypothetical protein
MATVHAAEARASSVIAEALADKDCIKELAETEAY